MVLYIVCILKANVRKQGQQAQLFITTLLDLCA